MVRPMHEDGLKYEKIPWATYGRLESYSELMQKCLEQKERLSALPSTPHFTFLINGSHSNRSLLLTLQSLREQSYPHWTARIWTQKIPNGAQDKRIQFILVPKEISFGQILREQESNPNTDWYLTGQGGDIFHPGILFEMVSRINRSISVSLFYPQEICIQKKGKTFCPTLFNKSADAPYTLLHFNYIGRCFIFRKTLLDAPESIFPQIESEGDFLRQIRAKVTGFQMVLGYWYYRGPDAASSLFDKIPLPQPPSVAQSLTAIICFRDKPEMTLGCLKALIRRKTKLPLKIVLVDNNSTQASRNLITEKIQKLSSEHSLENHIQLVSFPHPFNFGQMNNWAVKNFAPSEILLFLNNDVQLSEDVDLDTWAHWASTPDVGTVGICLKFPQGKIQHAGIRATFGDSTHLVRIGNSHRLDALTFVGREVFANTFAACMIRKKIFEEQGGLPSIEMANGFGDVFFNLSLRRKNLRNLYLGYFSATHAESASRGRTYEYWEEALLESEFATELCQMVRADLSLLPEPFGTQSLKAAVIDWLKSVFRSYSGLQKIKPVLKKGLNRVWPEQAHAKI